MNKPKFRFSVAAFDDLTAIMHYGMIRFGIAQSKKYINGLEVTIENLADFPAMGTVYKDNYRRHTYKRHNVFYTAQSESIFIVRILHVSMQSEYHLGTLPL